MDTTAFAHLDFLEILPSERFSVDLKYASTDNFVGENIYGEFRRAFLHRIAFEKLQKAAENLSRRRFGHKLLILDALRPRSAQWVLWNKVSGTDSEKYVADPRRGSLHNYGMAVDLTITTPTGQWLDMGSGFDDFRELSQPRFEDRFLANGDLTTAQVENRKLLRSCMEGAGFDSIPHEWWHFNALPADRVRSDFTILE